MFGVFDVESNKFLAQNALPEWPRHSSSVEFVGRHVLVHDTSGAHLFRLNPVEKSLTFVLSMLPERPDGISHLDRWGISRTHLFYKAGGSLEISLCRLDRVTSNFKETFAAMDRSLFIKSVRAARASTFVATSRLLLVEYHYGCVVFDVEAQREVFQMFGHVINCSLIDDTMLYVSSGEQSWIIDFACRGVDTAPPKLPTAVVPYALVLKDGSIVLRQVSRGSIVGVLEMCLGTTWQLQAQVFQTQRAGSGPGPGMFVARRPMGTIGISPESAASLGELKSLAQFSLRTRNDPAISFDEDPIQNVLLTSALLQNLDCLIIGAQSSPSNEDVKSWIFLPLTEQAVKTALAAERVMREKSK